MGLFTSAKAKLAAQKLAEEHLYELAAEEIGANNIRPGLWAKAIAEADGDDAKAKARYIKLRVETMKAEADLSTFVKEETAKATKDAEEAEAAKAERAAMAAQEKKRREQQTTQSGEPEEVKDLVLIIIGLTVGLLMLMFTLAAATPN